MRLAVTLKAASLRPVGGLGEGDGDAEAEGEAMVDGAGDAPPEGSGDASGAGEIVGAGVATVGAGGGPGGGTCANAARLNAAIAMAGMSSAANVDRNCNSRNSRGKQRHRCFNYEAVLFMTRCIVIVLDSGGIGALPDASKYGDAAGANTIGNVAARVGGLRLPNLERLGFGRLTEIRGVAASDAPAAYVARLSETSKGKDTITGHWEMAGIHTAEPFPTFPQGFPPDVVEAFTAICGRAPLGNVPASGTEIIAELGPEHLRTGRPILYTSADSVFQVAAHEEIVPLGVLYEWCERARAMLVSPYEVNRVIARPFVGTPGAFERTPNRRDYAVDPPVNLLDRLASDGIGVYGVGKICDIFSGRGITSSERVVDNDDAMEKTFELLRTVESGFVFVNLNDFDSKYGHRRDVRGYAQALERFDRHLPGLEALMRPGDVAVLTADHGCDPTAPGSDHTREYTPYVEVGLRRGDGGTLAGMEAVGACVARTLTPAVPWRV